MERTIETAVSLEVRPETASSVFRDDPWAVLVDGATATQRLQRRFRMAVPAPVGSGVALEHEVEVLVGSVTTDGRRTTVPLSWEPTGHGRLVPSFDGALAVVPAGDRRTELLLEGVYRVPLGPVGRFGDSVVGRRIARQSIAHVLDAISGRLTNELTRRSDSAPIRPAPAAPDLRDLPSSDNYLG